VAYDESLNDFTAPGSFRILCAGRWRFFYAWAAIFLLRAIITGVPLRPGLNIPLYRFSAAIFIPIFCLYIHRDDILGFGVGAGVGLNFLIPFSLVMWRIGFASSLGSPRHIFSCRF